MGIQLNDIGTKIEVTMYDVTVDPSTEETTSAILDISKASQLQLFLRKPSGQIVTKEAVLGGDGTDGVMYYLTVDGDLDETNTWLLQGKVTLPAGSWSSTIDEFTVSKNLWS